MRMRGSDVEPSISLKFVGRYFAITLVSKVSNFPRLKEKKQIFGMSFRGAFCLYMQATIPEDDNARHIVLLIFCSFDNQSQETDDFTFSHSLLLRQYIKLKRFFTLLREKEPYKLSSIVNVSEIEAQIEISD